MRKGLLLVLPLLAAGCGLREPLRPVDGQEPPPTPAAMTRPLTTQEMLAPSAEARPTRVDELITRSETRENDRFDLPPPEVPAGEPVVPTEDEGPE
jgi:hypothetical protein